MKVLILSVSTGYGHHATAGALAESLKNRGAEVEVVDIYEKINRLFQHGLSKGYLVTMKYLKTGYRVAYRYLEKRPPETSEYSMTSFINTLMGMKFPPLSTIMRRISSFVRIPLPHSLSMR